MAKFAVIKTGGKQYLVQENDEIYVDSITSVKPDLELETLALFDDTGAKIELGSNVKTKVKAKIVENLKGDKIRVAKFKAKVRYRKVRGFRPHLSHLKITQI